MTDERPSGRKAERLSRPLRRLLTEAEASAMVAALRGILGPEWDVSVDGGLVHVYTPEGHCVYVLGTVVEGKPGWLERLAELIGQHARRRR